MGQGLKGAERSLQPLRLRTPKRMGHCLFSLGIDCSVRDLGLGFLTRPSGPLRVPARCISRRGFMTGIVKEQPLRKMTSAAYTVGRHSISDGFAVDCQVSAFFATTAQLRVLPDEESRTWHVPVRRFGRSHGSASALSTGNRTLSPVNSVHLRCQEGVD